MIGAARPPCDDGIIRATALARAGAATRARPALRKRLILAATILGSSMAFVDGSVVNVALPAIQGHLAAGAAEAQWVVNAYLLMLGALVLVGGGMADRYGRRRVFVIGVALFAAASVACGVAPAMPALVAARAAQGLGAALLTPASLALIGATFDEHERSRAIGAWAGFGALTAAAGPVLGGWLVDAVSWRAIFFINVPLAVGAAGLALLFAPESRDPDVHRLDWKGALAAASGLAGVTWALTVLPERTLADGVVRAALIGGAALLLLFVAIEARARANAMMPLALYRSRVFSGANALTLLLYFALGGALFFLPFGLIRLGGYSATGAGAALLPFALIMGAGSSLAGSLADRWGARLSLAIGPAIAGAGFALLGFADLGAPYWTGVFPAIAVLAVGMTVTVAPLTSTVIGAIGRDRAGVASGVNNAVARVAGLLAVAALGVVFFRAFAGALPGIDPARAHAALDAVMAGAPDPLDGGAQAAFARAIRVVMWIAGGAAAAGGAIGGLMIGRYSPNG
jgi:EmrB/QacA subfamily drug resistance transporter